MVYLGWPFHGRSIRYSLGILGTQSKITRLHQHRRTPEHDLEKTISKLWFGGDARIRSVPRVKEDGDFVPSLNRLEKSLVNLT